MPKVDIACCCGYHDVVFISTVHGLSTVKTLQRRKAEKIFSHLERCLRMHFSQASSRSFIVLGASRYRYGIRMSVTRVKPFICTMPMSLDDGWNQVQFNLSDFTRRAYGTNYIETLRVQVHANCRIRRIYFCDRLYSEDEVPSDFKLFMPIQDTRYLEGAAYGNAQSAAYAKAHAKGKKKSDKETAE